MEQTQKKRALSQRRACKILSQPRSTQRYCPAQPDKDKPLVQEILKLSQAHPRYGYRRIRALLAGKGWPVNRKRVYRLWRQEGLKVPQRQRKRRRTGSSDNSCILQKAEFINELWSYDFLMDQAENGKMLKMLPILDEFTRECLTIEVEYSITGEDVIAALEYLFGVRGIPAYIRSDNGPEFIAQAVKKWLADCGVKTLYIEPGSPWENAYIESFNSRFRDEFLNRELFGNDKEAKVLVEQYRLDYNHHRPHSSLGYMTPAGFAATCAPAGSAALRLPGHTCQEQDTLITTGT